MYLVLPATTVPGLVKVSTVSVRRGLVALVLAGLLAPFAQGCGDDPPGANEAPVTEPSLTLLSVVGAGAGGWERGDSTACVALGQDDLQTVIAQVRIDGDWLLRPLHNCQSRTRCGYVEITVTNPQGEVVLIEAAASLSINLPFAGLSVPAGSTLNFTARLMDQNGDEYVVADGGVCSHDDTCSVTLSLDQNCAGAPSEMDSSVPNDDAATGPDATTGMPSVPDSGVSDAAPDATPLADASPDGSVPDASTNPNTPDAALDDASLDASDAADGG